jgi:Rne/Rng family ribonuclease
MTKEMIISSTAHETRVAILEDDQVVEVFIEREQSRGVVGNVYKGRVSKVLPGMQSAFVDLGLERDAFLYVSDVINPAEALLEADDEDAGGERQGGEDTAALPIPALADEPIDHIVADAPEGGDALEAEAALDLTAPAVVAATLESDPLPAEAPADAPDPAARQQGRDRRQRDRQAAPAARIEDLLKEGQEVVAQVVKEPLGTKGARITSHVSLPGRFLVYMPTVDHIGISRKIESREERRRLRGIVQKFREEGGLPGGVIIRTAAANRPEEDIVADLTYFQQVWSDVQRRRETERTPAVLFREESLVTKLLRDLLTDQFQSIRIDDPTEYQRVLTFVQRVMPSMVGRVKLFTKDYPIFEEYGVQNEIDKALRSKVWLKSGGYIVINQTEALVAIDVNTGRYVGKKSSGRLEDTIVKTNLEAAREIVRQIRLRDLGGIIVLDFIDMEEKKNRQKVAQSVEQELRRDRAPSKAVQVSDFGLIIITRKRVKSSLERQLTEPCPYCSGIGTIKASATICYDILSEVKKVRHELDGYSLVIRVNPEIARTLRDENRSVLKELEATVGRRVTIRPDEQLHHEQFDLMAI